MGGGDELHLSLVERIDAVKDEVTPPDEDATVPQWAAAAVFAGRYATATRWFRQVHGPDGVMTSGLRYWAIRPFAIVAALRASEGEGVDASTTDAAARVALRDLGLTWLDQEIESIRTGLDEKTMTAPNALRALERWTSSPGLKSIRDAASVAKSPESQRERLRAHWKRWEETIARVRPAD